MGNFKSALRSHKTAVELYESSLGNHEKTADSYSDIASSYFRPGYYKQSLSHQQKALEIRKSLLSDFEFTSSTNSSEYAKLLLEKAHYYTGLFSKKKVQENDESCKNVCYRSFLESHNKKLKMLKKIIIKHLVTHVDQLYDALDFHQNALEDAKIFLGLHERTADIYNEVSDM